MGYYLAPISMAKNMVHLWYLRGIRILELIFLPLIYDWIISDCPMGFNHGVLESIPPSHQLLPLMGSIDSSQHLEDAAAGHMLRMLCSDLLRLKISTDHKCDIGFFLHPNPQKTIKTQVNIDMCQIVTLWLWLT